MTSLSELRNIALKARGENSSDRLEHYTNARDEAFDWMTDGVMDDIKEAAKNGRFRHPIYRWTNKPRFNPISDKSAEQSAEQSVEDDTKVFFGNNKEGKNGLHIMSLINPKGIDRQHSLITKLRDFFNSTVEGNTDEERKDNQLRVYFENHPINHSQCAIFVSWDRKQVPRKVFSEENSEKKRFVVRVNQPRSMSNDDGGDGVDRGDQEDQGDALASRGGFATRGKFPPRGKFIKRGGFTSRPY